MSDKPNIFEGAILRSFFIEEGVLKTVQALPADEKGRYAVGSFYVDKGGEFKPKGATLMSAEAIAALAKGAATGKAVKFPTAKAVLASKPEAAKAVTKAVLAVENETLKSQNEALEARMAALEAKLAS